MSAIAACLNHPAREAIGVCVKCRSRVCAECTTKVEGINYCVGCLAALAGAAAAPPPAASAGARAALGWLAGAMTLSLLALLLWGLLEVALPA